MKKRLIAAATAALLAPWLFLFLLRIAYPPILPLASVVYTARAFPTFEIVFRDGNGIGAFIDGTLCDISGGSEHCRRAILPPEL